MGLPLGIRKDGERGELKRLSTRRKRKQKRCGKYRRGKAAQDKLNPLLKNKGDVGLQEGQL